MMEVVGWSGTLLYLAAQILLSVYALPRKKYVLLNALAAFLVSVYSLYAWSLQPVFINVVWTALSLIGLKVMAGEIAAGPKRPVAGNRVSLLIMNLGAVVFLLGYWLLDISLVLWLSWLSFWLYSATYFSFIFFRLSDFWFFLYCIVSAAIIIPQLYIDSNYPVIGVQALWIFWSTVGLFRVWPRRRHSVIGAGQ